MKAWQWEILLDFFSYCEELSDRAKEKLQTEGLTIFTYHVIRQEVLLLSKEWKNERIRYTPKFLTYECNLRGYDFRLAHYTETLVRIGQALENQVGDYRDFALRHHSVIMSVKCRGQYVAYIEIQEDHHIVNALGIRNQRLKGTLLLACRYWVRIKDLTVDTDQLDLPENVQKEEIRKAEEAFQKSAVKQMNLLDLLSLPKGTVVSGYYMRMGDLFNAGKVNPLAADGSLYVEKQDHLNDERLQLMYIFPKGKRIYDAAFGGNMEAMRTLAFMYCQGTKLQKNYDKALYWLSEAAMRGSAEASWEVARLKKAIASGANSRELAILQGIFRLRHRMLE